MTEETWTAPAVLCRAPASHQDPRLDGPPLVSADGHWWWDGRRWVARAHAPTAPAA